MAIRQIVPEIENAAGSCFFDKITGGTAVPGGIRTHDLPLRSEPHFVQNVRKTGRFCQVMIPGFCTIVTKKKFEKILEISKILDDRQFSCVSVSHF